MIRKEIFHCAVTALLSLTLAVFALAQENSGDYIEEFGIKTIGEWQVPVKILRKVSSRTLDGRSSDAEEGFEGTSDDSASYASSYDNNPDDNIERQILSSTNQLLSSLHRQDKRAPRNRPAYVNRRILQPSNKTFHQIRDDLNNLRRRQTEFHPLCEVEISFISFEDSNYMYKPARYHEVSCKNSKTVDRDGKAVHGQCVDRKFQCVQLVQKVHISRRDKNSGSDCWGVENFDVKAGCECMWPPELGDISQHY